MVNVTDALVISGDEALSGWLPDDNNVFMGDILVGTFILDSEGIHL